MVFWVPGEELLDVVTALSGSGPAYFFLLAELMAEAGVRPRPREPPWRNRWRRNALRRPGLLAHTGDGDLARLRAGSDLRGGTTEAALRALEAADLRATVRAALDAATQRRRELGRSAAT